MYSGFENHELWIKHIHTLSNYKFDFSDNGLIWKGDDIIDCKTGEILVHKNQEYSISELESLCIRLSWYEKSDNPNEFWVQSLPVKIALNQINTKIDFLKG
jgi:hypothetical protein